MSGVWREFRAEYARQARRPSLWALALLFFVLGWGAIQIAGGALTSLRLVFASDGETLYLNSPFLIHVLISTLTLLGIPATAALVGGAVGRDYAHRTSGLIWTTGLSKWSFWWGRFSAAIALNLTLFAFVPLGIWIGTLMPWLDAEQFGETPALGYLHPLWISILPRCLLAGAVVYVLVARTRRMLAGYMASVIIIGIYGASGRLLGDLENRTLAALLDPSGSVAAQLLTRYWSIAEQNTLLLPLSGPVLANRLLWGTITLLLVVVGGWAWRPEVASAPPGWIARSASAMLGGWATALRMPRTLLGKLTEHLPLTLRLAFLEYRGVVAHPVFWVTVAIGCLALLAASTSLVAMYGTTTWPVTHQVLSVMSGVFRLFALGVILFFSGEMIWRERQQRIAPLLDALPRGVWQPIGAKLIALLGVIFTLQSVLLAAGLLYQRSGGYDQHQLSLFVGDLFGFRSIDFALFAILAVLLQVVIRQQLLAYLATVLVYLGMENLATVGLGRVLYRYGGDPGRQFSRFNGFGPFLNGWWTVKVYWLTLAVVMTIAIAAFWVRGEVGGFGERLRTAARRWTPSLRAITGAAALLFVAQGGWIWANTDLLNHYQSRADGEELSAQVERTNQPWKDRPQPRIVASALEVDLFPAERDARLRGRYTLRNRTDQPIDELLLRVSPNHTYEKLEVDRPHRLEAARREDPYRVCGLDQPLLPGEELHLDFDFRFNKEGFANTESGMGVVANGTFLNSSILPGIGYNPAGELRDRRRRKELGLPKQPRMLPVDDPWGRMHNDISADADRMDFEVVVSTSEEQTALAPGDLVEQWSRDGRRYFRYRSAVPILNFFAFVSGRYQVERDQWGDVTLEIYYDAAHRYNVDTMMRGMKASLEYLSEAFGPYPHKTLRIVEFPRYAVFAQSFPTVIPFSEGIGFIARLDDPEDIDYPFYVTAHEVAHQWWGHEVVAAQTEGATLLIESLAQYSALRIMEKQYGHELIGRFLRYELDRYLVGRAVALEEEQPLAKVHSDQQHLHYNKGSLATYALADRIGMERMDTILAKFVRRFGNRGPPYPTSEDLLTLFSEELTREEMRWADDLLRRITFFDLETVEASCTPTDDGRYEIELKVRAQKFYADGKGQEKATRLDDWIDIAVLGEKRILRKKRPVELYLEAQRLTSGEQTIHLVVDRLPLRAGIDPYNKLVDRTPGNNVVNLECSG